MSDAIVAEARAAIDVADRELLALVNRRVELVRALHEHKERTGIALRDERREQEIVAGLQTANGGPLSAAGVAELVRFLLDLTRRELHGA